MSFRRTLGVCLSLAVGLLATVSCAPAEDDEYLGPVTDGKGDFPEIKDKAVTLKKKNASGSPSTKTYSVTADGDFRVELRYETDAETQIVVVDSETNERVESEKGHSPTLSVPVQSQKLYKIKFLNYANVKVPATFSVLIDGHSVDIDPELVAAASKNLDIIKREVDYFHLQNYGLTGATNEQFLEALRLEYEAVPDMYLARMKALGSMVFFAAPDILPPDSGKLTPFHGLDMEQFDAIIDIEDSVFNHLTELNDFSTVGVRPFSVCETNYIIETYVRPKVAYPGFDAYKAAYETYAASCPQADKDDWYNFRGLGALRPSWVESNIQDRFLRRMVSKCQAPTGIWVAECDKWNADRLGYRLNANRQLASRELFYEASTEDFITDPGNSLVLLEDRNGDGVGEFFRDGPAQTVSGENVEIMIESTGQFSGTLKIKKANGTIVTAKPQDLVAESAVDARFDPSKLDTADFGLMAMLSDGTGCTTDSILPDSCPLLKRFYSLIDRHEDFYQTYSAVQPDRSSISSQPSPLVACSITLGASHAWDSAGTPSGGTAGFIFLMRIPFAEILAGTRKSISTLSPGPKVLAIQDLYAGERLDLSKVWLDVASLSNNQYESEHEISKFGAVPAEQIEGILVIRKPANMP